MHKKFKLTLRTPEDSLVSKMVESVYLTTEAGDMMLLPQHASVSASMAFSPVIIKDGERIEEYSVYNGVIFFSNNKNEMRILAQRASLKDKVDYDGLKAYLRLVQERIEKGEDLSGIHMRYLEGQKLALVEGMEVEAK